MMNPQPLGLKKSFGYGDRLGVATPGHLAASRKFDFAPIFAQQSIREMERTRRTPEEVMTAARNALQSEGYTDIWGADADHLKTAADVALTAAAGFCFFTIDPSTYVENRADEMGEEELVTTAAQLVADGTFNQGWIESYLGQEWDCGEFTLRFTRENLLRAAAKYGRAVAHCEVMSKAIASEMAGRPFEIEVSVDETDSPTSIEEHAFFALELQRRGVTVVSLAPRFIGDFEKGIDYRGDEAAFEESLKRHVAVSKRFGPYKISIHSGSDKFSIYPIIGRVCGDLLHVKTAGTSYIEALRVAARVQPSLLREIADYSVNRFATDRLSYHISTSEADIAALSAPTDADLEGVYLDTVAGRQLVHVTFGSVLTVGQGSNGRLFKESLMEVLNNNADLHRELLDAHFTKHLSLLNAG
jgi:hypothetical protein